MLQPKKVKYRHQFRGKMRGNSISGSTLTFGEFGLKSLGRCWLKANQIEAARKVISHVTKRKAKVWIRVFPDKPVSKKAPGAPMGAGKGDIDCWAAVVKPGRILFEIGGIDEVTAKEALLSASHKLPIKTKIISKEAR